MAKVYIKVYKKSLKLKVFRSGESTSIFSAIIRHGGSVTRVGDWKIQKWVWGAVACRYEPNTWFSYGATFKGWPDPGAEGVIKKCGQDRRVKRESDNIGYIKYNGNWYKIWKDNNLFGAAMADLNAPNRVELHGTGKDEAGKDQFPAVTHGCIRTTNKAIIWLRKNVPAGSIVKVTNG